MRHQLVLASAILATVWTAKTSHAQAGVDTYKAKCMMCHAADGSGSTPAGKAMGAISFTTPAVVAKSNAELIAITTGGKLKMPAYKSQLSAAQIAAVVTYIRTLQK